jgi:hypothetical protein
MEEGGSGAEPTRYFFVHLQKTGGTALYQRLRDHFGPAAVFPTPEEQSDLRSTTDVDFLLDRFEAHRDELKVVTGHFPLSTVELFDVPFVTFTVLRDPVERTLSLLRKRSQSDVQFQGRALDDIYADGALDDIIHNHMVKMLSLNTAEMTSAPLIAHVDFDDADLALAKRNLEQRIDVFGLQERFDEFCMLLETRFGWDLGPPRFANRTEQRVVDDDLRGRIAADNRMDVELYQFAEQLWAARQPQVAER